MGDHPLRPPSHRSPGGPLPRQPANGTHAHPFPPKLYPPDHAALRVYGVLIRLSAGYPPGMGRLHTRYAPVRRSPAGIATPAAPRLACVRPAASVHPEPGSNSPLYRRSFDAVCFLSPRVLRLAVLYYYIQTFCYACFPVYFFLVPSRQRTRGVAPAVCCPPASAGLIQTFFYPQPSGWERKGNSFFRFSYSQGKIFLFIFLPFSPSPIKTRTPLLLQSGCKYRTCFFILQE